MMMNDADCESFLENCLRLYEDLETAMGYIDLLMHDLALSAGEIRDAMQGIDRRMNDCEAQLKHLVSAESLRDIGFQGSLQASKPETGGA